MISTEHTQSLSDFRKKAAETINRLNETGDAEILTVNGEARAVLLSPAVYDALAKEAELARDLAMIQLSRKQFKEGKSQELHSFFRDVRAEVQALKARKTKGSR